MTCRPGPAWARTACAARLPRSWLASVVPSCSQRIVTVTWFYGPGHNMGRTAAVSPLLGPPSEDECGWRPGSWLRCAGEGERMMLGRREGRLPRWVRLPGRTVRFRLTFLYGILFVVSGALLLAIASG